MCVYILKLLGYQCLRANGFMAVSVVDILIVSMCICLPPAVFFLQMLMNVQIPQPALVVHVSIQLVVTPVSALQILS